MKITNKHNVPQALYDVAIANKRELNNEGYSVTELLSSTREILLKHRHYDEICVDVADLVPAMFGSAVHKMFENGTIDGQAEIKLKTLIGSKYFTGVIDLVHDDVIEDYKTTSVSKVAHKDFDEHRKQILMYAWLMLNVKGVKINHGKLNYLMKDWSKLQSYTRTDYPGSPIYVYEFDIQDSDYDYIDAYIRNKIKDLTAYGCIADDDLPECSDEERWYSGDTFAVFKKEGDKRAIKVFNNKEEADNFAQENNYEYVEERKGENTKCMYYCDAAKYCNRGKKDD